MDEQRVYTQSEVIDIVRTVHNLRAINGLLRTADLQRERYIDNQLARRVVKYYEVEAESSERIYREGLEEGDQKIDELKVQLRETIKDYEALPETMQRTLCDMLDLDLDKIGIHLL